MGYFNFGRGIVCFFGAAELLLATSCAVEVGSSTEALSSSSDDLFGCTAESRIAPFVTSSARLNLGDALCSATLVAPNQLISAAHCFCEGTTGTVNFADSNGSVPTGARAWPILNVAWPDNAKTCTHGGDWADSSENDASFHQPWDIAIVTIGPDALGTLPAITPTRMYLGDADIAFQTRSLTQEVWSVGYGNNAPAPWTAEPERCLGCSIRRSGPVGDVRYGADPCSYLGPIPLEQDCYNSPIFFAKSISEGNLSETSKGDSGGGLFFNIDISCTNSNLGTAVPGVVAGVLSAWSDDDTRSRWASFGLSQRFICDRLNVPLARTALQQRSDAVYARSSLTLNDRTRVVTDDAGHVPADVSSSGPVNLGVQAFVGNIRANGSVWLRDRSVVQGAVLATGNIVPQNGVVVQSGTTDGSCTKFADFSLVSPFPAGTSDVTVPNDGVSILSPGGSIRDVTVRARGKLRLSSGAYAFRNVNVEAGATLEIADNSWVYVTGTDYQIIRGDMVANPAKVLIGFPNASNVLLSGDWRAALVAPKGNVIADMHDLAKIEGNFFVDAFTLHQGRWFQAVPFLAAWVPTCDVNRANCH